LPDPNNMNVKMAQVEFHKGYKKHTRLGGLPGVTAMAFSPNDQHLVAYGQYGQREFRATVWNVNPRSNRITEEHVEKLGKAPFSLAGSEPIRFVGNRTMFSVRSGRSLQVIDLKEMNLKEKEFIGTIEYPKTQRGSIEVAFSEDGRWTAAGNDSGEVFIWSVETQGMQPLTLDGRPAHDAPIVGLAFSPINPVTQTIDYMVTASESGVIRIWSLVDRLEPRLYRNTGKRLVKKKKKDSGKGKKPKRVFGA